MNWLLKSYITITKLQIFFFFPFNLITNINFNLFIVLFFLSCVFLYFNQFIYVYIYLYLELWYFENFSIYLFKNFENIHVNLLNGLFSLHPLLIYLAYAYILLYLNIIFWFFILSWKFKFLSLSFLPPLSFLFFSLISYFFFFALLLGGWWAFQEINWGGWWNWDLVELINFFFFFFFCFAVHINKFYLLNNNYKFFSNFLFLFLVLTCIIRYNIVTSVHSFINDGAILNYIYLFPLFIILLRQVKVIYIFNIISFNFIFFLFYQLISIFLFSVCLTFLGIIFNCLELNFLWCWIIYFFLLFWIFIYFRFFFFYFEVIILQLQKWVKFKSFFFFRVHFFFFIFINYLCSYNIYIPMLESKNMNSQLFFDFYNFSHWSFFFNNAFLNYNLYSSFYFINKFLNMLSFHTLIYKVNINFLNNFFFKFFFIDGYIYIGSLLYIYIYLFITMNRSIFNLWQPNIKNQNFFSKQVKSINLNFGPQHPAAHGVLRLILQLNGEIVEKLDTHVGLLHRGSEKLIEDRIYLQGLPYFDRFDYVSMLAQEHTYCLAIETLLKTLNYTSTFTLIRTLFDEITRLINHLLAIACHALDVGSMSSVFWAFEEREKLMEFYERVSGARMHAAFYRPNEINMYAISTFLLEDISEFNRYFFIILNEMHNVLTYNKIWKQRLIGIGAYQISTCLNYGLTGVMARSVGLKRDLRLNKLETYANYYNLNFRSYIGQHGDSYDRFLIRMNEMSESINIMNQVINKLSLFKNYKKNNNKNNLNLNILPHFFLNFTKKKEWMHLNFKNQYNSMESLVKHFKYWSEGFNINSNHIYKAIESPKGEFGVTLISNNSSKPYKCKVRSPAYHHLQVLPKLAKGHFLADLVTLIGTIDIVFGEVDR